MSYDSIFPELKPCPFCGGKAEWCELVQNEDGGTHCCDQIVCTACEYNFDANSEKVAQAYGVNAARVETAKVWNKRVTQVTGIE